MLFVLKLSGRYTIEFKTLIKKFYARKQKYHHLNQVSLMIDSHFLTLLKHTNSPVYLPLKTVI